MRSGKGSRLRAMSRVDRRFGSTKTQVEVTVEVDALFEIVAFRNDGKTKQALLTLGMKILIPK